MTGLTHPCDESRVREIVREELASVLSEAFEVRSHLTEGVSDLQDSGRSGLECAVNIQRRLGASTVGEVIPEPSGGSHVLRDIQAIKCVRHSHSPYGARAVTRYLGAILTASGLQRKAGVRRPASLRPSDAPQGGAQ